MGGRSLRRRTEISTWQNTAGETGWATRTKTMTSQTLGNYQERSSKCEYLTLAFSPINAPLHSRWRNNGLSADFLGDYVTTFLPTKGGIAAAESRQNEIKHAVTYIANELLENA